MPCAEPLLYAKTCHSDREREANLGYTLEMRAKWIMPFWQADARGRPDKLAGGI